MIYDQLSELSNYKGLHPNLDAAIDALAELDLIMLDLGKHSIDGNNSFFMLQENRLDKDIGPEFEVHRDYLDLQFLLEGREIIKYGFGDREVSKAYDPTIDFGQETCEREMDVVIDPDHFAIYFPGEAHRPNVYANAGETVKKCVVKVLID
ncbi:YhcH/YjgK/YiaL family protein [Streptococcus moroccensis]|uniref:YhcH/YjgK/YiaL family protein n=1 Tax=Streptococcus moroccensis TaxID=1451356 RepID=A0ABT9YQV0_9STRE|nr:YhcH/YjgK/YiaL family protein [Streptococcus moroccensis]MDQ0222376.1 YhcH/YjgK/YiaL family protein [Streptococcus moroccensis]